MATKVKHKETSLNFKLSELNRALKKEDLEIMTELGFIGSEGSNRCAFIQYPYANYTEFKENTELKDRVQCPLYSKECDRYTRTHGVRPCVVLYKTK